MIIFVLLACGGAGWLALTYGSRGYSIWSSEIPWIAALAGVCFIPQIQRPAFRVLRFLQKPSIKARGWMAVIVGVLAGAFLWLCVWQQHRELFPTVHDESMYLLQARMLSEGRLWMPPYPLAGFIETFHIFVRPVYSSIYFPGTAGVYCLGMLAHVPAWFVSLIVCSAIVGMIYRIVAELLDGTLALLGAFLMVSLPRFRHLSILVESHPVALLLGLLMIWAYLRWRRKAHPRWAIALGIFSGWAAITRPLEAVCFAAPLGLAMVLDLLNKRQFAPGSVAPSAAPADAGDSHEPAAVPDAPPGRVRIAVCSALYIIAGAVPFLSVQLAMNYGVTGHLFKTPFAMYAEQNWPHVQVGRNRSVDPNFLPHTSVQQIQDYYQEFVLKPVRQQAGRPVWQILVLQRLPLLANQTLPSHLLVVLLPVGLLSLSDRRRLALWLVLPLFLIGYSFFIFFQRHYTVAVAPVMIFSALAGAWILQNAFGSAQRFLTVFLSLGMIVLGARMLPQWGYIHDDDNKGKGHPVLRDVEEKLAAIPEPRAVVLFRYRSGDDFFQEPVYNIDTAWPDDAPIIRLHDRGPEKLDEVISYFDNIQPDRMIYLYDRRTMTLIQLGTAEELHRRWLWHNEKALRACNDAPGPFGDPCE